MAKQFIGDLFFNKRWYFIMAMVVVLFCFAYFIPVLFAVSLIAVLTIAFFTVLDYALLFGGKGKITAQRITTARFSLGDENSVQLSIHNTYKFKAGLLIIDEQPTQLQQRNFHL